MLNERLTGYLHYFEELANQPANRWDGFYLTQQEKRNFALRFQIAFPCLALGVLCLHPDAEKSEQERCHTAMAALIDRMIQRRVWAYWAIEAERHGLNPDPVYKANVQYSGLLAMMIGVFEAAGGDDRYDDTFTLLWTGLERFPYDHHTLTHTLYQQMHDTHHHGIDSDPGRTYVDHMNPVLLALALHDGLHGSQYQEMSEQWLTFVRRRMLLYGPRLQGRGVFGSMYMSNTHLPVTTGLNYVDGYTLTFLHVLDAERAEKLIPRFFKGVRRVRKGVSVSQTYVPSASMWSSMEVSDQALTTGFGYILAVQVGDTALAQEFLNFADYQLQPVERDGKRYYNGCLAVAFATALFAIGEAGGLQIVYDAAHGLPVPRNEPTEGASEDDNESADAVSESAESPQSGEDLPRNPSQDESSENETQAKDGG